MQERLPTLDALAVDRRHDILDESRILRGRATGRRQQQPRAGEPAYSSSAHAAVSRCASPRCPLK
jgi:hypothetical protein